MHALILDGQILRRHDFGDETPPTLSPNKGKWVEVITAPKPEYDQATQVLEASELVDDDQVTDGWAVRDKTAEERRADLLGEIARLEAMQTPRRLREAALTEAGRQWLADLDARIEALRVQL